MGLASRKSVTASPLTAFVHTRDRIAGEVPLIFPVDYLELDCSVYIMLEIVLQFLYGKYQR